MINFFGKKSFSSGVEYIVAGLGNPDKKYELTRHNAGFIALDLLGDTLSCEIKRLKFKSYCGEAVINGKKLLLMKPQTYMNNSGQAVIEAMNFYKLPPENVIVVFDDISLEPGKMRIRRKGSDGGQKGMGNIIYLSGSENFPRIKLGTGQKPAGWELKDWVLSRFSKEEYADLLKACKNVLPAVELITDGKIDTAMNRFN